MKARIVLFFCFIKAVFLTAQTEPVLVKDNMSWSIVNYNLSQGPFCVWQTYNVVLTGDTAIDMKQYKIVKQSEFGEQPENWAIVGFIREDSLKRVYFKNDEDEVLLYNFGVSTGEIVDIICPVINPYSLRFEFFDYLEMKVKTIDSVEVNGIYKRRIQLNPICVSDELTYWIEGIGDYKGILNSIVPVLCFGDSIVGHSYGAPTDELLCCKEDGVLVYVNSVYGSCYYYSTAGINDRPAKADLILYPNPVVDISTIKIVNSGNGIIKNLDVYNLNGEKVKSVVTKEDVITIDRNDFQRGIFVYKLLIGDNLLKSGKLIIE